MKNQKEKDKEIYSLAKEYLTNFLTSAGIAQKSLDEYLSIEKPKSLNEVYMRILESGKNRKMMKNVVEKAIGSVETYSPILCEFDTRLIIKKYGNDKESWNRIVEDFRKKPDAKMGEITQRCLVGQYFKVIISGAAFLSEFKKVEEFYSWVEVFDKDSNKRHEFFKNQKNRNTRWLKIDGFGLALACDFLKEIGYLNFSKPDIHLKGIFASLQFCEPNPNDITVIKIIERIAENVGVTPYNVDKVFWLIGSGNFYLHQKQLGRNGDEFIRNAFDNGFGREH